LDIFLHLAFVWSAELRCSGEAKLRGEAIVRPASLGERSYALTKITFLF